MGLLDDLEQEAQRRKAGLDEASRLKQEREGIYKSRLEPAMQAIHEYLARLIENLKFLKPRTQQKYEIPGYGAAVGWLEHDYDLKVEATPLSKEIVLGYTCTVSPDDSPQIEVQGAPKIKALNANFQKVRLAGIQEFKKDDSGEVVQATFRARGKVPMSATIAADADGGVIKMTFVNFEGFGAASKAFGPDQISDQLFEDLARYVAREPSNLFREAVSEDFRKQLQQKIQQEQMRRKWEAKIADQQREELERLRREQSLKARVERTVQGVKEKAPSILERVKGLFGKKE